MTATRGSGIPDLISAYTVAARDITCDLDHARVGDLDLDLDLDLASDLARDLERVRDREHTSARDLAHLRNRARDLAGFLERLHLDNLRLGDMELTIHVHDDGWELAGLTGSGIDLVRSPRPSTP